MKYRAHLPSLAVLLLIVALPGCSRESLAAPTAPPSPVGSAAPPPATGSALLWVMVIADSGVCVEDATIQIVRAQGAGESMPQETPCDAWAYYGGLLLDGLNPGEVVTLRGAAPGYAAREGSFLPFPTPGSYRAVFITLSKAQ